MSTRRSNDFPVSPILPEETSYADPEQHTPERNLERPAGAEPGVSETVVSPSSPLSDRNHEEGSRPVATEDKTPESSPSNFRKNNKTAVSIILVSTLFPILFASVVGRLMFESARWKLEKGGSLGSLEQLMGSRTVGSTLWTVIQFRTVNLLAAALVLVWAFSPLGAQAILRMLNSRSRTDSRSVTIASFDNLSRSWFASMVSVGGVSGGQNRGLLEDIANIYTIVIMEPRSNKLDAVDLWGNVKIPMMDSDATDGWNKVAGDVNKIQYSSLVGIPVSYDNLGDATFSLESSYLDLECPEADRFLGGELRYAPKWSNVTDVFISPTTGSNNPRTDKYPNGTWHGYDHRRNTSDSGYPQWGIAVDRFVDRFWFDDESPRPESYDNPYLDCPIVFTNETGMDFSPTKLLLRLSLRASSIQYWMMDEIEITCHMSQKYVESRISCSNENDKHRCKVVEQRRSEKRHSPESISHLSFPRAFNYIARDLPAATGKQLADATDPSVFYLAHPIRATA
ncbi:uncharacterized protein CLUP02_04704 [Colletotrichum lupini]|uniref:Uncharacterized protein n=1 Tax=Colletotrichum lupini TaxID=145971 RepID=A0A9Q8SLP6_9PEZI|nr:uncharacterized protein CLUP02_04704 [Colletotrichum lupini]UQC79225.1 hypothetical protein CLUP02_04704 [Colletotrichum lupini]